MSNLGQQIQLPDGRKLGYGERGPSNGKPLFYFHGSPSSRLESDLYVSEELLGLLNVRLVAVDRPGMGISDFQPDRRLLDWPQDVLALADHLNLERFGVLAYSLGGPYAAACAYAIPERLSKVGIVSGAALFTVPELIQNVNEGTRRFMNLPREKPWLSHLFLGLMLGVMPRLAPTLFIKNASSLLPIPDRALISADPELQKRFIRAVREGMRQGTRGAHYDSLVTVTDWGFRLEDIQTPVLLWHGEMDQNVPVGMARYMTGVIPKCQAKFYADEGHLSLFKKNAEDIIRSLIQ
ncbi:MAG TPA: alpha/beta hydrolase [Anaerolineales bacterium]|nr:alpha/beta hydrolase [Anaerolineales bacterium]